MSTEPRPGSQVETSDAVRHRVRACITSSGQTQREFAGRIGLDPPKLSKALGGTRRFTTDELVRIATVAGVTVNWLMAGSDFAPGAVAVPGRSVLPRKMRGTPEQVRKRQEIVLAAWRRFAEQGFEDARLSEIARDCGVAPSVLSYYFASKRELFEECLRYCVKLAFDRQVAGLDPLDDPRERLERLVELQLPVGPDVRREWSIWLQSWSAVTVGAGSQRNHSRAYQRWFRAVRDVVAEGQQAGVFTTDDSAEGLAIDVTALFDGLGIKVLVGSLAPDAMRTRMRRHVERAVLAAPGSVWPHATGPHAAGSQATGLLPSPDEPTPVETRPPPEETAYPSPPPTTQGE